MFVYHSVLMDTWGCPWSSSCWRSMGRRLCCQLCRVAHSCTFGNKRCSIGGIILLEMPWNIVDRKLVRSLWSLLPRVQQQTIYDGSEKKADANQEEVWANHCLDCLSNQLHWYVQLGCLGSKSANQIASNQICKSPWVKTRLLKLCWFIRIATMVKILITVYCYCNNVLGKNSYDHLNKVGGLLLHHLPLYV
jgi:hypothetical protein